MKRTRLSLVIALAVAVATFGCGDDDDGGGNILDPGGGETGLSMASLVGTWTVTSWEWVSTENATLSFDLIADGGVTISMTVQQDGAFNLTAQGPGGTENVTGTLQVDGNQIVITSEGETDRLNASLAGTTLTLNGTDSFDFDEDGVADAASLTIVLQKQA